MAPGISPGWIHAAKKLTPIETSYTDISDIRVGKGFAVFTAGSPTQPLTVVRMDLETGQQEALKQAFDVTVDPGYFSIPRSITLSHRWGRRVHTASITPPPIRTS